MGLALAYEAFNLYRMLRTSSRSTHSRVSAARQKGRGTKYLLRLLRLQSLDYRFERGLPAYSPILFVCVKWSKQSRRSRYLLGAGKFLGIAPAMALVRQAAEGVGVGSGQHGRTGASVLRRLSGIAKTVRGAVTRRRQRLPAVVALVPRI